MGCATYTMRGKLAEHYIHFSEMEEELPCLCTFPYNDAIDKKLDGETVMSLALLGATVAMIHHQELTSERNYIPDCIPDWIVAEIKTHIII